MTLIEVIVAMVIVSIAIAMGAAAFGGVGSAETRRGAGDLATAVRYTYNLAAINNELYALYLDLDGGTYHAAPIKASSECDRLLLNTKGADSDPMITRYGDTGKDLEEQGDPGLFGVALSAGGGDGGEPKPPGWTSDDDGSNAGKLLKMISQEARELGRAESESAGLPIDTGQRPGGPKRVNTYRKNQLGKPRKLPDGVVFGGVVLRDGQEPIMEGTVPILFYPHGFTQRALIYLDSGGEEDGETFTVEVLSLRGSGVVHDTEIDPSDFAEVRD